MSHITFAFGITFKGLSWQELKLLVGPPTPDRPRMTGHKKNDILGLQVGGCVDGLVTLPHKNKYLLIHLTISLSQMDFCR
jgi:hypothetical protein